MSWPVLRFEVAPVVRHDHRRIDLELARDRVDALALAHRVERAFGRRNDEALADVKGARVGDSVRVGDGFDGHVIEVRHRRQRVALVDRHFLDRSRAFGGDGGRVAARRDRAASDRLRARHVAGGDGARGDRDRNRARARCGGSRKRQRENEYGDRGVEREAETADADETGKVASRSLDEGDAEAPRAAERPDDALARKARMSLKEPPGSACRLRAADTLSQNPAVPPIQMRPRVGRCA